MNEVFVHDVNYFRVAVTRNLRCRWSRNNGPARISIRMKGFCMCNLFIDSHRVQQSASANRNVCKDGSIPDIPSIEAMNAVKQLTRARRHAIFMTRKRPEETSWKRCSPAIDKSDRTATLPGVMKEIPCVTRVRRNDACASVRVRDAGWCHDARGARRRCKKVETYPRCESTAGVSVPWMLLSVVFVNVSD